ncbi:Glycosyltransferase [Frankia canadensis]|uniref:Glycosyltransferase n=1 Tax=Frankia canadensis TaxID=1836972 RepID=A0A2I2KQA7_9ACTN|nr:glycosyltransferase family 4 protein [Frankia canadensis]SNQ47851.1 Glycosyltransferase [Frankia canadensis]SOU55141.1 Glycosyltransferase [Frankia canadensis]
MRVVVATEARFHRGTDDAVMARTPGEAYQQWATYLDVFQEVVVLARVTPAPAPGSTEPRAGASFPVEGDRVRVAAVPPYQGMVGYLRTVRSLRAVIAAGLDAGPLLAATPRGRAVGGVPSQRSAAGVAPSSHAAGVAPSSSAEEAGPSAKAAGAAPPRSAEDAAVAPATGPGRSPHIVDTRYLAVMPGLVGAALVAELRRRHLPYALEIIGDAEAVAGGMFGPWARPAARRWLRRYAAGARAVGYVTRETLQRRYPPAPGAITADYAYGRLGPADFTAAARPGSTRPPIPATVVTIGSQERRYKGHDVLLSAAGLLDSWGYRLRVVIVGSGRHHDELVRTARREGLDDIVIFVPTLNRAEIRALLDVADLFVLPSRTEGLPRVLIEAMARGVPAIASAVGGIGELLAAQDLVAPDDPVALAVRMTEVLASPDTLAEMSARNRAAAEHYRGERTAARARAFYAAIAAWDRQPAPAADPSPLSFLLPLPVPAQTGLAGTSAREAPTATGSAPGVPAGHVPRSREDGA